MKTMVAALALCLLYLPVYQASSIDIDKKFEEMEARLTKTEKELMDHKQMTESQKNDDILRDLEAKLKDTEKQVEDLRAEVQAFHGQDVAFGASLGLDTHFGPFTAAITVTYKNVFTNIGSAYQPGTGIFTAPVKGVYYFSFSANHRSTKISGLYLMKNGKQMISMYNDSAGNSLETAANGMTLQLEVGDQVYMRLWANSWIYDNPNNYCTFIGFLLFSL
ncbi:hypothetical protein OYC64_017908 [Pagothenia borchgrevinki]|uniref:C1q domain-containing protein n=1 Tax=Pagothenia borchgrevinki TaxID=8213 RepID=A0ABD2GLU6_PAGBO